MRRKDPNKVKAGREGGKVSGANFKRDRKRASSAGLRSSWLRNSGKLKDFPLELEDVDMNIKIAGGSGNLRTRQKRRK